MSQKHVIRPRLRWVYFFTAVAITIGFGITSPSIEAALAGIPGALLLVFLAYAIFLRPSVELDAVGVTVKNPFSSFEARWASIAEIGVNYTAFVEIEGKRYSIFAANIPSRYHSRKLSKYDLKGSGFEGQETLNAKLSPQSETGEFFLIANRLRDGAGEERSFAFRHNRILQAVGVALGVASFATVIL